MSFDYSENILVQESAGIRLKILICKCIGRQIRTVAVEHRADIGPRGVGCLVEEEL